MQGEVEERQGGIEPRFATQVNNGNEAGLHHPSSAVARDTYTRTRSASALGRDGAATLLQSRFRGYHARKHGNPGGGALTGDDGMAGTSSQIERRGIDAVHSTAGRVQDGTRSILDFEVTRLEEKLEKGRRHAVV